MEPWMKQLIYRREELSNCENFKVPLVVTEEGTTYICTKCGNAWTEET